jgi:pyruvate dehydrogenase E2 component (dihydrolipoamide acetyltransferase)
MMKQIQVFAPDIGDFKDVAVIELLVKIGDIVHLEQSLITVESDKASIEIPSSAAGVIKEMKVKLGDKVNSGDLVVILEGIEASEITKNTVSTPTADVRVAEMITLTKVATAAISAYTPNPYTTTIGLPHASPSVRKFARELGVPLNALKGNGRKGRITSSDVQAFARAAMSDTLQITASSARSKPNGSEDGVGLNLIPWPKVDFAKFGPVERKNLSRIKKISGANLLRNAVMIPTVNNHDDADITDLENFRDSINKENEKSGVKITMLAFLIKACVATLKKFPEFNSSLDGDVLVYKNYWHVGFAVDTPNGLMVPVIKDCDIKGIFQITNEMSDLAKKAREGKLSPSDMSGATFTISSLGGIGGRYFTPIINAPEVAILGICRSKIEPIWDGNSFRPRLMLPLSLAWDHRVIDGVSAARFNVYLGSVLSDFRRLLL